MPSNNNIPHAEDNLKHAALKIAAKGKPVFPCKPDKAPHTRRGFLDATSQPDKVSAFWERHPGARIGVPTGGASGILVIDVDRLEALEALPRELPKTLTIRTPSGGLHYYYRFLPGLTNRRGALPPGIDVRGEGGYVLVPPSHGYRVQRRAEVTDLPEWLLELIRAPEPEHRGSSSNPTTIDISGPAIPQGTRDETLTRICGKLHDGNRTFAELEADLQAINDARCAPPLPPRDIRRIARSIFSRKPYSPGPNPKALSDLDGFEASLEGAAWIGRGGKSERDLLITLIKIGRKHARPHRDGVLINASVRDVSLKAALPKRSVHRAAERLEKKGWLERIKPPSEGKSGGYLLMRAYCHPPEDEPLTYSSNGKSGDSTRAPYSAPRLRWSIPRWKPPKKLIRRARLEGRTVPETREGIDRLGKGCGHVIDILETAGGKLSLEEVYARLNPHKDPGERRRWRPRDLIRRKNPTTGRGRDGVLARLEDAGILEVQHNNVMLLGDWLEALDRERARGREIADYRRDMKRYNIERKGYRQRHKHEPSEDRDPAAERRARDAEKYVKALEAFGTWRSGPALNLQHFADGEMHSVEYLVKSVLAFHGVRFDAWERWREPVLEAARDLIHEKGIPA